MNPLSLLGLGTSLVGGLMSIGASRDHDEAQQNLSRISQQTEDKRYDAMILASRRQQTEIIRNAQRARALALNTATNQGAQFGTGLQGGIGQIQGQSNWMLQGNAEALDSGQDMFALNREASMWKRIDSSAQSSMNTGSGIMSLGGSLIQNAPTISRFFGNIF